MAKDDGLLLAIAGPKAPAKGEEAAPEEEMGDGLDMATEEILSAFEAKDTAALRVALESFVSMAGAQREEV